MEKKPWLFVMVIASFSFFSCSSTPPSNDNSSNSTFVPSGPVEIVETKEWIDPSSVIGTVWIAEVDMGPFIAQRVYEFFDGYVEFSQRVGKAVDKSDVRETWSVEGTTIIINSPDGGVNRAIVKDEYFYFERDPDIHFQLSY